ncbi:MAG: hypothetical protein JXL84_24310 [Deltaproteobacteria bacterium]|nr:hypothetical protein [Deltaproteobacteria bacterium]
MTPLIHVVIVCVIFLSFTGTASAALSPNPGYELVFKAGLVSAKAVQAPAMGILEKLARYVGMEIIIFGAPPTGPVSIDIQKESPERVLRILLRGVNYAVVHNPASREHGVRIVQTETTPAKEAGSQKATENSAPSPGSTRARVPGSMQKSLAERPGTSSSVASSPVSISGMDPSSAYTLSGSPVASGGNGSTQAQAQQAGQTGNAGGASSASSAAAPQGAAGAQAAGEQATANAQAVGVQAASEPPGAARKIYTPVERLQKIISGYEQRISSGESDRQYQLAVNLMGPEHVIHDSERLVFFQDALKRHQGD